MKKLNYTKLTPAYDKAIIEKYINLDAKMDIIGQENAIEALCFGLNIKNDEYNIYVSGVSGVGKHTCVKKYVEDIASTRDVAKDLVYVYNFKNEKEPKAIFLRAGLGKEFKEDLEEFIYLIKTNFPKLFFSKEFEIEKEEIFKKYNKQKDLILNKVKEKALAKGFGLKNASGSIYFMPINEDVLMTDEEFEALQESEKDTITDEIDKLQEEVSPIVKGIKNIDEKVKKELENLYFNYILLYIGRHLSSIQNKYIDNSFITSYLLDLKEDLIDNILAMTNSEEEQNNIFNSCNKKNDEDAFDKYCVNVIVDNSGNKGAPVIIDYNPSYANLVGEIEFENELGNFSSDYMKIKGGLLHKANGGFLILNIEDILKNHFCFETLLKVLKTKKLKIEPLKDYQVPLTTIKPQVIDIDFKLILIGSSYYYEFLSEYEEDFNKYFKIHSIFDYEMENTEENIKSVIGFIKNFEQKNSSLKFDISAIKRILEYSSRIANSQDKLSTKFNKIENILFEANIWAKMDNREYISKDYIQKAIDKKKQFLNIYEKKYEEMILKNEILIDTYGKKIGSINGLSVLDYGDICFGKPIKITATTYMGKAGIINVEKEVKMSGAIYDKGVEVISGYIGHMYGDIFPLSLSCRLCFEQNYSGIDGDSASLAELLAVISSLSDTPIRQDMAITGSVNQFGDIQPIGGVNEKIEGFFDICKKRGLKKGQGVIIPLQNVSDLCLKEEVIESVKKDIFSIYPVSNIDEAIFIIMEKEAGKKDINRLYKKDTIHYKVMQKLKYFYQKMK